MTSNGRRRYQHLHLALNGSGEVAAPIFASGEEFLASLPHASPSCPVVDLHMPGLKGLDVLLRIRSEGLSVPVIIVTGFDQSGMRMKCIAAGASGYLVKPIERSEMASAIEAAIRV
jgi:FixJ family two-component response regulator